jgi:hypothetical protein
VSEMATASVALVTQPVCSYLTTEVVGSLQLENTLLKDIGLTGGRAIVRFELRQLDSDQFEKANSQFREKLTLRRKMRLTINSDSQSRLEARTEEERTQVKPLPSVHLMKTDLFESAELGAQFEDFKVSVAIR